MATTILAWATDPELRRNGSSGGFTRTMLIHLLQTKTVDRVLYARTGPKEGGFQPGYCTTDDPDELRDRKVCSVYYAVPPYPGIVEAGKTYAATTLPCLKAQFRIHQNVKVLIELLCHYTPKPEWTWHLAEKLHAGEPQDVAYRGDGWPGNVTINGVSSPLPAMWNNDVATWGLPKCRNCKLTYGGSDIVVADPWGIKQPMGDGKTLAHWNTPAGEKAIRDCCEAGMIETSDIPDEVWDKRIRNHRK